MQMNEMWKIEAIKTRRTLTHTFSLSPLRLSNNQPLQIQYTPRPEKMKSEDRSTFRRSVCGTRGPRKHQRSAKSVIVGVGANCRSRYAFRRRIATKYDCLHILIDGYVDTVKPDTRLLDVRSPVVSPVSFKEALNILVVCDLWWPVDSLDERSMRS